MDVPNFDIIGTGVSGGRPSGLLMGLDPKYQAEQIANDQARIQLHAATLFQDGLPTDAQGGTDWNAAYDKAMRAGAYDLAGNLVQTGIRMSALNDRSTLDDPMGPQHPRPPVAVAVLSPRSPGPSPRPVAVLSPPRRVAMITAGRPAADTVEPGRSVRVGSVRPPRSGSVPRRPVVRVCPRPGASIPSTYTGTASAPLRAETGTTPSGRSSRTAVRPSVAIR